MGVTGRTWSWVPSVRTAVPRCSAARSAASSRNSCAGSPDPATSRVLEDLSMEFTTPVGGFHERPDGPPTLKSPGRHVHTLKHHGGRVAPTLRERAGVVINNVRG